MSSNAVEIVNWNIAWKSQLTKGGKLIQEVLRQRHSDILCLCESHIDFMAGRHGIFSDEDYGYPMKIGRRKVALWARTPWEEVSTRLPDAPPGRFVEGVTEVPQFGPLRVIGVCVPWDAAHVSTGNKNRKRWEDHVAYLRALTAYLNQTVSELPTVLLGDFNQTVPPSRAPIIARDLLSVMIKRFEFVGKAEPEKRSVSHMMLAGGLRGSPILDLPQEYKGVQLSDHRGHIACVQCRKNIQKVNN